MKKAIRLSLLIIFQLLSVSSFAQQLTDDWRLTKKVYVEPDGVTFHWEYFYEKDGRIQKVKSFGKGQLLTTDSKFKFDNNGKITSFSSVGADAEDIPYTSKIQYDDKGRVSKITGADASGQQIFPTNTYSYSGNKTTVIKVPVILGTSREITTPYFEHSEYYTEKGDYIEMTEERPSEIQKFIIFPRKNPKSLLEPDPDSFTAGYESFLLWAFRGYGHIQVRTALASKITKDKNGLIVSVVVSPSVAGKTYTEKVKYTYTKITGGPGKKEVSEAKVEKPEKEAPAFRDGKAHSDPSEPIIKTNIKCEAGKIKIIKELKKMDGVFEVKIDIKTGLLKLNYSSDGSSFDDIINAILDNGFDVVDDGEGSGIKKSAKPAANPCKTKTTK